MIAEGVQLMVVGMGTVFSFLVLLVLTMHGLSAFVLANAGMFPEPEPLRPKAPPSRDEDARVAVILAAIAAHRARRS